MSRNLKFAVISLIMAVVVLLYFRPASSNEDPLPEAMSEEEVLQELQQSTKVVNDTIYYWDEQMLDLMPVSDIHGGGLEFGDEYKLDLSADDPIEIEWFHLMNIYYQLKYFKEVDMEMYSPIFTDELKALHGREVIIKGFVIPFEVDGPHVSLSYGSYASCFFCGKASPASVISMYLKNKKKRYSMDAYKKFKGTLTLNYDDPNEFYYILKDAKEVKE